MIQTFVDRLLRWLPWTPSSGSATLLARVYDTSKDSEREACLTDFCSRVQLTYRSGLSVPLQVSDGRVIASDSGWGCMLRATQMMLAQCFVTLLLGRDWRYEAGRDLASGSVYLELISCFLDIPEAPVSLHRLVEVGQRLLGKEPSDWFGPTSAARAAGHCIQAATEQAPAFLCDLRCAVFEEGVIYKETVLRLLEDRCRAVIILVCMRLGLGSFNTDVYRPGLQSCFSLPEFQGLASGNSGSSAHFFVGTHEDSLLFLDPHTTQSALESVDEVKRRGTEAGLQASRPLRLRWSRLNPSLCLGFVVKSSVEFLALCEKLQQDPLGEVFEILEREPMYKGVPEEQIDDVVLLG